MRTFTDLHTGNRQRWNSTVVYYGMIVPERLTMRTSTHWHPHRVPEKLLRELNTGTAYEADMLNELLRRKKVGAK